MNVRALLKQVPSVTYIYATLAVILLSGYNMWAAHLRADGKREILLVQSERTNADLRHQQDSLAKVYRIDTLRLTYYRTKFDTSTITVDRWKTDTLRVVEYVRLADSTVKACSAALQTCEARVAVAQRGWDGARAEIAVLKQQIPSKTQKWLYGAVGLGVGVLAGRFQK